MRRPTYASEESVRRLDNLEARVRSLEALAADHVQRLDTAQTHLVKRLWWWLWDGWPLTDWNADRPARRPWHRRN